MWPNGFRSAAAFTFDFDAEEVWIAENPENANKPGALSVGTYGAKVAVPLILHVLRRHQVKATFFVPGRVGEDHGNRVREILADGHEVAYHGYTHRSPAGLSREEEEDEIVRGRGVLESLGAEVVGCRCPSWEFSANTLSLLEAHRFQYSSNMMDDIRPYRHENSPIVEIPIQWIIDDAAYWWFDGTDSWLRKISSASEVGEIWKEEFLGIRDLGGSFILTMHPQLTGRPSRLAMLDAFINFVKGKSDVWIATCREIAAQVQATA